MTTFGESHCRGVGVIIDGVPPQLGLTEADVQPQLTRRRPGQSRITTPRSEADRVTIMSGTEMGKVGRNWRDLGGVDGWMDGWMDGEGGGT